MQPFSVLDHDLSASWPILLVDDEPTQRLIVSRWLRRAGYAVQTASNGREALEMLQQGNFPLLITDWEMPEMDGAALCSALRACEQQYTYIVLLTSRDAVDHLVAGLQSGADDYLIKPVTAPELVARLNTGKRIVRLERSLRAANEQNRLLSITDPLTGVHNRRYLMEQLPREIDRAIRYGRQLSAIMCDVDHFKKINDQHGHLLGDEVLKWFAAALKRGVRTVDCVARYGGEEFVVMLPETSVANALTVANNLREQITAAPCPAGGLNLPVTASFGVSGWSQPVPRGASLDVLVDRCDAGVYASKEHGRDRITVLTLD